MTGRGQHAARNAFQHTNNHSAHRDDADHHDLSISKLLQNAQAKFLFFSVAARSKQDCTFFLRRSETKPERSGGEVQHRWSKMRSRLGCRTIFERLKKLPITQRPSRRSLIRDVFARFRKGHISVRDPCTELGISHSRLYSLYSDYLSARSRRRQHSWKPGTSGGRERKHWPRIVTDLLRKLLSDHPSACYSFAASEVRRGFHFKLDRASVRRWAPANALAPDTKFKQSRKPVRRWQFQQIGQLWQHDASPHRWFSQANDQPSLLQAIDDHSRLLALAQLYPRENPSGSSSARDLSSASNPTARPHCQSTPSDRQTSIRTAITPSSPPLPPSPATVLL
jgi:hypothetical protein